jgi:hypothetical protein
MEKEKSKRVAKNCPPFKCLKKVKRVMKGTPTITKDARYNLQRQVAGSALLQLLLGMIDSRDTKIKTLAFSNLDLRNQNEQYESVDSQHKYELAKLRKQIDDLETQKKWIINRCIIEEYGRKSHEYHEFNTSFSSVFGRHASC